MPNQSPAIRPFRVSFPDEALVDLRRRVVATPTGSTVTTIAMVNGVPGTTVAARIAWSSRHRSMDRATVHGSTRSRPVALVT